MVTKDNKILNEHLVANSLIVVAVLITCIFIFITTIKSSYEKPFVVKSNILDIGEVRYLLNPMTYLRDKQLLIFFDEERGWAAMSMQSSIMGCDLSMQDTDLYDPCSRSWFKFDGSPAKGRAKFNLPFFKIYYETYKNAGEGIDINLKRHLLVNTGEMVDFQQRFFAPQSSVGVSILGAIPKLKELNTLQGVNTAVKVPNIMRGRGDGEKGKQFSEQPYKLDYGDD